MQVSLAGGGGGVSNIYIQLCITCGWSQPESVSCQNSQLRVLLRLCRPHWLVGGGGVSNIYTTMYNMWMVTTGERIVSAQSAEGVAATMQASLAGWWWWWWWWWWWCAE